MLLGYLCHRGDDIVAAVDVVDDGGVLMFLEGFYDVVILLGEHRSQKAFNLKQVGIAMLVEELLC